MLQFMAPVEGGRTDVLLCNVCALRSRHIVLYSINDKNLAFQLDQGLQK
jgi:hypothetical protein